MGEGVERGGRGGGRGDEAAGAAVPTRRAGSEGVNVFVVWKHELH